MTSPGFFGLSAFTLTTMVRLADNLGEQSRCRGYP